MAELKVIERDLVPVYETDTGEKVVYGSELHAVLDVKSRYREWIDRRLSDIGAIENDDFQAAEISAPSGQTKKEYIIKLDTAKEMAMLERNDKGKEVRKYFIAVEKKYKSAAIDRSQLSPTLQALNMLVEGMNKQELDIKKQNEKIEKLEQSQEVIKEAVSPVTDNWREEIIRKVRRIQNANGVDFKSLNTEMYRELERRAGCDLNTRLRNKQVRMYEQGCTKTAINNLRKLDIIDEDKKLREIYGKIVSEYIIRYCA